MKAIMRTVAELASFPQGRTALALLALDAALAAACVYCAVACR